MAIVVICFIGPYAPTVGKVLGHLRSLEILQSPLHTNFT